jgi:6-phosphogluconate dehydrogenase
MLLNKTYYKMKKSDIGVIGLAVMGENIALNLENKGWQVSVYNRTTKETQVSVVERLITGRAKGKNILGFESIEELVDSLSTPRKIMMMVRAGSPVDEVIEQLLPFLSSGDILIDGGNSNYEDTARRVKLVEEKGFYFVGAGVSGGEEGALNGASIMPGGSAGAWFAVRPILQSIAAKAEDGSPCCEWIGGGGSGHFVKMIHNGIEYGDMQLISEAYFVMKRLLESSNEEMAAHFATWNEGKLKSYLVEITSNILRHKDAKGEYLIDKILDTAGQKGTGKWSVINAMELGMPLNLISTAVFERSLSARKELRVEASHAYNRQPSEKTYPEDELIKEIYHSLYASKLVSYAQGFNVLRQASEEFGWKLNLASIARIWRGGCIIRSSFLNEIAKAFDEDWHLSNLLLAPYFKDDISEALPYWKKLISVAAKEELPVPAFSSALNYFYSLTTDRLPANLVQAQRDYFGAHTFERVDLPRGVFSHENWTGQGGDTKSGSYNA